MDDLDGGLVISSGGGAVLKWSCILARFWRSTMSEALILGPWVRHVWRSRATESDDVRSDGGSGGEGCNNPVSAYGFGREGALER